VVGGDGTLFEAVNGLRAVSDGADAEDRPVVTLLPAGTGNDFARSYNLTHDLDAALERVQRGRVENIDLIRIDPGDPAAASAPPDHDAGCAGTSRWAVNVANGGFGRQVADEVTSEVKDTWGVFAYLKVASGKLVESPVFHAELTFDDQPPQPIECSALLVCNGRYVGGGRELLPPEEADPGDRRLHVITITANTFYERLGTATRMLTQNLLEADDVQMREVSQVTVRSSPDMGFTLDGEPCCETPLTFTLEPAALRMTVPASS
jgi:diacylglycerol kinase (ATP)